MEGQASGSLPEDHHGEEMASNLDIQFEYVKEHMFLWHLSIQLIDKGISRNQSPISIIIQTSQPN